ncbi:MAG TPA: phosphoribosyltransferase family protein [Spongiibacteraceae bacterium]|nr:phosphoribosyltransferase family protein [Spongiibacteraceae bacterium]
MPESSAEYHLYWDELHRDCRTLAQLVLGQPWIGIAGIARGGVIPATILARELGVRLLDTLCITSYSHDRQGEVEVLKSIDGDGAGWLIVDDLVDTGGTRNASANCCPPRPSPPSTPSPRANPWPTTTPANSRNTPGCIFPGTTPAPTAHPWPAPTDFNLAQLRPPATIPPRPRSSAE